MPTPAVKWQDPFLADMRKIGDPLADATIDRVFEAGEIQRVNDLLMSLVRNNQMPTEGLDPHVQAYLTATEETPVTDPEMVREAQQFFVDHGDLVLFSLVCASLPECYTMKKGINVLWMTQKLNDHALRRLLETAQMVLRILTPGGLEKKGAGIAAASKVRLMHAAIRRLILHGKPSSSPSDPKTFSEVLIGEQWNTDALGYPINQTDLAYTLLTFSHVIPRSMVRLGVEMTTFQKDAFVHCWNVVGQVMGILPEMLPADYAEAELLYTQIKEREGGASVEGQAMTAALMKCMKDALPGHLVDFLPVLLMRELMDPATCSWLGIPAPTALSEWAQKILTDEIRGIALVKRDAHEHLMVTPMLWDWAAGKIVNFLTNYRQPPGWNRDIFTIPDELATSWNLPKADPT
ncbi:MAG: oxygenase MpaB family protein [Gemmatimonadaceae bacterium]